MEKKTLSNSAWKELVKYGGKISRIERLFGKHIANLILEERAQFKAKAILQTMRTTSKTEILSNLHLLQTRTQTTKTDGKRNQKNNQEGT